MVAVLPDFPFFGLKIAKMKFKTIVLPRNYDYQGFRGFWTGNEQFKVGIFLKIQILPN